MPRRWAARAAFLFAAVALASTSPVRGQGAGARDSVSYYDRKDGKIVTIDCEVKKESAAGIELAIGKESKVVPAPDIVRVDYGGLPGVTKTDINAAKQFEETNDLPKAAAKYASLLTTAGNNPKAKRYLTYRAAAVAADLADSRDKDDEFATEATKAAKQLADFAATNDKAWEVWPAANTAARMYAELGDYKTAGEILGKLARVPDLTPDLRFDAKLGEAAMNIRAGNTLAAGAVLAELDKDTKVPATDPLRQRAAVLKVAVGFPKPAEGGARAKPAEAVDAMEKALAAAPSPAARAVGFNLLGDLYRTHGFPRDAMWAYLWVDVVYPQEKAERVLAGRKLAAVFEALGDTERAAAVRDRLPQSR